MSKAKEIGKFIYIEPNDLYGNKPSNSIPQPYDDYSMAVDLQVEIPSRDSCGDPNFKKILYFSSDNGTISFFGGSGGGDGKQGFLTTNFTDISPMNVGKGNKETLGISRINITYDSWFFPVVTINFVDVRGASLMMPQEYAYRTEISNNTRDISQIDGGSFFKALFSFPYPLFKLTVKGFYGRAAVYNLAVKDFKASFNSESGNFECVAQFIGYMFGVYTDIPMTYLAVAPYIGRSIGSKYGPSWEQSDFHYHSEEANGQEQASRKMMTFPEFKLAIFSANTQLDKVVSSTKTALDMNEVRKKRTALSEISMAFSKLGLTKTKAGNFYYRLTKDIEDYDFAENIISLKQKVENFCNANYSEKDSGSLKTTLTPLFNLIENKNGKNYVRATNVATIEENTNIVNTDINFNVLNKGEFDKNVLSFGNYNKVRRMYVDSFTLVTDFVSYAEKQDREYEKKLKNFEIELQKEKLKALENILGFYPSIKNIFDMTFAHMETFVKEYYNMLNEVRDQMEHKLRKPETFGFRDENDSDFRMFGADSPSNSINPSDKQVPPFPLFVQEVIESDGTKINRQVGPWEVDAKNMEMPEMQFVIKLLNASKYFSEDAKNVNETIEKTKDAQGSILPNVDNLVPVTLYDFANPSFNPYKSVQYANGKDTDKIYQIILIFFLRWFYFAITFGSKTTSDRLWWHFDASDELTNYFAQMEAFNLKKALPNITQTMRTSLLDNGAYNRITSTIFNENKINPLWDIKGKSRLFTTDGDKIVYNWLEDENGKKILPVGEFSVNNIKTDLANGNYANSNKYVFLTNDNTMFDLSTNKLNFTIDENGNLFEDTISAIKNADDGVGDVKEKFIDSIRENSIFTKANGNKKTEPYINSGKIFTTGIPSTDNSMMIMPGTQFVSYYGQRKDNELNNEKTYTLRELKSEVLSSEELSKIKPIGDGTVINGDFSKSVFDNPIFNLQTDDLSKAYLFILSLPLKTTIFQEGKHMIKNGTTLKSMLLREGAYYWREKEISSNVEPILISEEYVSINEIDNQHPELYMYITGKDSTLNFITREKRYNFSYEKFSSFDSTEGRKTVVRKYFENWANTEFKRLLYIVKNNPKNYFDDEDYKNIILNVLTDFESIIDEAPQDTASKQLYKPSKRNFEASLKKFIDKLNLLYLDKTNDFVALTTETNLAKSTDIINDKDIMLSTYLVLKSLYDKWFCGMPKETWFLENERSDFKNFKYIDSYYNNIGHKLIPNINTTLALVNDYMPAGSVNEIQESSKYTIKSMHEFLSENCEKIGVYFKSLPLMYGLNPTDTDKIDCMFDAIPFSKYTCGSGVNDGQTYICMYTYKPSEHLDIRDDNGQYDYIDDSFDIADINGDRSNTLPASLYEIGKNTIPAFGVTYAAQNQSYFKNISVSMENPMQTEASIATTMALASKSGDEPRNMTLYGQDLYRVYSNYSYTCSVDMMGNSQVVPMMYFQLNNIPMFRGAYMIIKVEHDIVAGNMTTKFTGVRQNKNAVPLVVGAAILLDNEGDIPVNSEYTQGNNINFSEEGYTDIDYKTPSNVKGLDTLYSYSFENPLICLTPAHGPYTQKNREWAWSSKLIDHYIIPQLLKAENGKYAKSIRRCNIDGANTDKNGYSGSEVRSMIEKHGSNNVISLVPHWNGAGGNYFGAFKNKVGSTTRPGSELFCQICVNQSDIVKDSIKKGVYGNNMPEGMMNGKNEIFHLGSSNTDWAVNLNCDCVLTENWFADYKKIGTKTNSKGETVGVYSWEGAKWLESDEGMRVIADMTVNSIISFIKERQEHPELYS